MADTNNSTAAAHSAGNSNTVAAIHVGTPSPDFQEWKSTKVYFHGFADLRKGGGCVDSPIFSCLGHKWSIRLYPFSKHDERVSLIYLVSRSTRNAAIDCSIIIKDRKDNHINRVNPGKISTIHGHEFYKAIRVDRYYSLSMLVNGALVVEVRMKLQRHEDPPIIPTDLDQTYKLLSGIFNDKESADVVFEVGGKHMQVEGLREKAARTEIEHFYAHTLILKKAAPLLAELIQPANPPFTTVQIPNMRPSVFRVLLRSIYLGGFDLHAVHLQDDLEDIIKAADRFGIIRLKLEAEAGYVTFTTLTLDNVMENLHFADSLNLALLKEAVMDFIVKNKVEMLEKRILTHATIEGLGSDILAAMVRGEKYGGAAVGEGDNNFNAMSVSELRHKAHSKGLDIDGSREMLISALEKKKELKGLTTAEVK